MHTVKFAITLGALVLVLGSAAALFIGNEAEGQSIPVRVVRFNGVSGLPASAVFTSTFEGIGFDNTGKVFTTLCDAEEGVPGRGNCFVFSWDPVSGTRRYYDNFLDAARRAGNLGPTPAPHADWWTARETLVKGHTHLKYMNNQMWMGSMNAHGYQPEDMHKHRGVHLFALDLATGLLVDHSQWQPKGVFHERGGTYTMEVVPDQNLVLSIGIPNCTIIKYNPTTRATVKIPGVPTEDIAQLSGRDMVLLAGNKLLYQCGSGSTRFGLYDVDDGTNEILDFTVDNPISLAYAKTADGQTAYINTSTYIYRFDLATKTGTRLAPLMADATNRQTGPVNLSPDEKKLYYVVNMNGPEPSPYLMDLYEYNLETGVRTKIVGLKAPLGENAKLSGSHSMKPNWRLYQVFNGSTAGVVEIDLSSRAGGAPGTVATPTITPNGGTFTTSQSVSLSTATVGATIRYTTDGSTPTTGSTLYGGAFTLTDTKTVKAKAWKTGMTESAVASATFTKGTVGPTSCLQYPSNSTPPGLPYPYGASWDVLSPGKELLVKSNCPTSGNNITITIGKGNTAQFIWSKSYGFNTSVTPARWDEYTLTGTIDANGWITSGSGTKNLTTPMPASASNPFFFVGYVCTFQSSTWKCGCRDAACSTKYWQLQAYKGPGSGGGGDSDCSQVENGLFRNPFNLRSAHHRPIGAGATLAIPRGITQPDFTSGKRSAAFLQEPTMTMEQALSRIGAFRLGTSEQGRKGVFCVASSDSNAAGTGSPQLFREFIINSATESIERWTTNTMLLKIPRGDTVRGGNNGVFYPPNPNGGDYTYAFVPRDGNAAPVVDMFTDFVGPISSAVAAADPAGNANAGEMGYTAHGTYRLDGSDTQETPGYAKSAARLRWPGTVLRGFEINSTNPAPIRHSFNAAVTRHNGAGADNGAHILGKHIVWPAHGVDGSLAGNYNRTDQNQGGFPYGTNLRVPVGDYSAVAAQLSGNPRGLAMLHALTYYGIYLVDGHGEYVTVGADKKGVIQMRIDEQVGRNPDGSDIPGVVDDVNDALRIIMPYLKPVGNPPLWTELNSQFTSGLPYLGGGGQINGNSVNTAYDVP